MPAADDLVNFDFDDGFDQPQQSSPPVNTPPSSSNKKNKKKSKKYAQAAAKAKLDEEEETPYPNSITPSPLTQNGVRLQAEEAPPPTPAHDDEPSQRPQADDYDDEGMAWDESPPTQPIPPSASGVKSPPPPPPTAFTSTSPANQQLGKPAQSPALYPRVPLPSSPQRRVSTLYGSSGTYGNNFHQPEPQQHRQQQPLQKPQHQELQRPRAINREFPRALPADPPPPHMPQAHFMGLPDWTGKFNVVPQPQKKDQGQGRKAGSDGCCCVFDTFSESGDAASAKKARDALLVGWKGGLDVYRVLADKMEVIGRLEGLRGGVIGARVVPGAASGAVGGKPLVVVIVHGEVEQEVDEHGMSSKRSFPDAPAFWQTTVEVYSLHSQKYVATLYRSVTVPVNTNHMGPGTRQPEPIGDLEVEVAGRFITVSSGLSGEVYIFTFDSSDAAQSFRCIGKYWTLMQTRPQPASRPGSASDGMAEGEERKLRGAPLLSLSPRWLALCPPATTSSISVQGSSLASEANPQPFGINTHVAPQQPPLNCEVAGVDDEGTFSKLSRQAAQGLVQASQKGYTLGMEAWKELTHPSPPSGQQHAHHYRGGSSDFPPTNAPHDDPRRLAKEPTVVSLIDLYRLLEADEFRAKHAPQPLATFVLTEGCNYLSLSPNGLRLLTSNRKGEVTTIWDLSQATHAMPSLHPTTGEPDVSIPCIKQIHRIPRSSPSILLDSVWNLDARRVALLTANGTVHLHEIPNPTRTRKRRRGASNPNYATINPNLFGGPPCVDKAQPVVGVSTGLSPPSNGGYLSTLRSTWAGWGAAARQPEPPAPATPSSSKTPASPSYPPSPAVPAPVTWAQNLNFAGFRATATAASKGSSRAVAKGLRLGLETARGGLEEAWRSEENKIRVKELSELPTAEGADTASNSSTGHKSTVKRALRWLERGPSLQALAIVTAGTVTLHPIERVERLRGETRVWALRREKAGTRTFSLPLLSSSTTPGRAQDECSRSGPHGFWLPASAPLPPENRGSSCATAAAMVEVETNPPYCPFHVDARVGIYAFVADVTAAEVGGLDGGGEEAGLLCGFGLKHEEAWIFGQEVLGGSVRMNGRVGDERGSDGGGAGFEDKDEVGGHAGLRLEAGDLNADADLALDLDFDEDDEDEGVDGFAHGGRGSVRSVLTVSRVGDNHGGNNSKSNSNSGGGGGGTGGGGGGGGGAKQKVPGQPEHQLEEEIRVHTTTTAAAAGGGRRRKGAKG